MRCGPPAMRRGPMSLVAWSVAVGRRPFAPPTAMVAPRPPLTRPLRFETAFALKVPHGLCVGVRLAPAAGQGAEDGCTWALPTEVQASKTMLSRERQLSYCGGRAALRKAMADCGAPADQPIARDGHGAPVLPEGVLGSISHTRGLAVALVRLRRPGEEGTALGVDVERAARALRSPVARRVLTAAEAAGLEEEAADDDARRRGTLLRFSFKEAVYKAASQLRVPGLAFRALEVRPHLDGTAAARWVGATEALNAELATDLRWREEGEYFLTFVEMRRV
mmetsp:Transcript_9365/g.31713  ORF Transcript_9365/g.31713 Transcript_9365/m.31713 type:complete len:279 (+) Transcript_9365:33-869(+)